MDRDSFLYLQSHDVASVVNSLCDAIMRAKPTLLNQFISLWVQGCITGHSGGVALLVEDSTGTGRFLAFDSDGNQTADVDELNFQERHVMVSDPGEEAVYFPVREGANGSEIRMYNFKTGELVQTTRCPKRVSALCIDKASKRLWVAFQGGSGAQYHGGAKVMDLAVPPVYSIAAHPSRRQVFVMTEHTVESRNFDTAAVDFVIHLYKESTVSTAMPYRVIVGEETLWTVHVHGDHSAAQISAFDTKAGGTIRKFADTQVGSQLTYDPTRGGIWALAPSNKVKFIHANGISTSSFSVLSGCNHVAVADGRSGLIWLVNSAALSGRVRLYLFDCTSQTAIKQIDMPDVRVTSTMLACAL